MWMHAQTGTRVPFQVNLANMSRRRTAAANAGAHKAATHSHTHIPRGRPLVPPSLRAPCVRAERAHTHESPNPPHARTTPSSHTHTHAHAHAPASQSKHTAHTAPFRAPVLPRSSSHIHKRHPHHTPARSALPRVPPESESQSRAGRLRRSARYATLPMLGGPFTGGAAFTGRRWRRCSPETRAPAPQTSCCRRARVRRRQGRRCR